MQLDAVILFCESLISGKLGSLAGGEVFEIASTLPSSNPLQSPADCTQFLTNLAVLQSNLRAAGTHSYPGTSAHHRTKAVRMVSVSTQVRPMMLGFPEPSELQTMMRGFPEPSECRAINGNDRGPLNKEKECSISACVTGESSTAVKESSAKGKILRGGSGGENFVTLAEQIVDEAASGETRKAQDISDGDQLVDDEERKCLALILDIDERNGEKISETHTIKVGNVDGVEEDSAEPKKAFSHAGVHLSPPTLNVANTIARDSTGKVVGVTDVRNSARFRKAEMETYEKKRKSTDQRSKIEICEKKSFERSPTLGEVPSVDNSGLRHSSRVRRKSYKLALNDMSCVKPPRHKPIAKLNHAKVEVLEQELVVSQPASDSHPIPNGARTLENAKESIAPSILMCHQHKTKGKKL